MAPFLLFFKEKIGSLGHQNSMSNSQFFEGYRNYLSKQINILQSQWGKTIFIFFIYLHFHEIFLQFLFYSFVIV
jgi:hypothetical protein